jgi:hypothetical protein
MADAKERRREVLAGFGLSAKSVSALAEYGFVDLLFDKKYALFLDDLNGFLSSNAWPNDVASELKKTFVDVPIKEWGKRTRKPTPRSGTIVDFEAYLCEHPEDVEAWQVYSDKLQTEGDSLGEYIALLLHLQKGDLSVENRKEAMERLAELSPKKLDGVVPCFFIEELPDRYRLHNVHYGLGLFVVDWSKNQLDNAQFKTQDNWLKWLKGKEWKLPDALLYNAVVFEMYHWREHSDSAQRKMIEEFRKLLEDKWIMTCTRLEYNPDGKDIVIHNFGYEGKPKIKTSLVGTSNVLVSSNEVSQEMICAILGIEDKKMIDEVYTWLSTKRPYVYRLEEPPQNKDLGVVVLGRYVDSNQFLIDLDDDFYVNGRAFGVAVTGAREFHRK